MDDDSVYYKNKFENAIWMMTRLVAAIREAEESRVVLIGGSSVIRSVDWKAILKASGVEDSIVL